MHNKYYLPLEREITLRWAGNCNSGHFPPSGRWRRQGPRRRCSAHAAPPPGFLPAPAPTERTPFFWNFVFCLTGLIWPRDFGRIIQSGNDFAHYLPFLTKMKWDADTFETSLLKTTWRIKMDQIPKSLVTSRVILTCNQIPGRLFLRRVRLDQSWLILLYKDGGSICICRFLS